MVDSNTSTDGYLVTILCQPPFKDRTVALIPGFNWPVDLRHKEVHPSLLKPELCISKCSRVRVKPRDRCRHAVWFTRSVQTKRAYAKLDILPSVGFLVQRLDEVVDVATSPVTQIQCSSLFPVSSICLVVWKGDASNWVRVEVVVDVNAVNVIPRTVRCRMDFTMTGMKKPVQWFPSIKAPSV